MFDPFFEHKTNPFLIDFPYKKELSLEDYLYVQERLRKIDIKPVLKKLHCKTKNAQPLEEFIYRCSVGINQKLIDVEQNQLPLKKLEKIGNGGKYCIVSSAPYDNNRNILLEGLVEQLHSTGFNGYIYYRIGGYPNPTGKEIRYAGVPYAIKIFMMMEAYNLGFNKILWLDSSIYPLKDPSFFFKLIEKFGAIFHAHANIRANRKSIFYKTRKIIKAVTQKDPLKPVYIPAGIFGLDFSKKKCKKFLNNYLYLVRLGTPFLSCRPEEFVFTSLLDEKKFKNSKKDLGLICKFLCYEGDGISVNEAIDNGYYFINKIH